MFSRIARTVSRTHQFSRNHIQRESRGVAANGFNPKFAFAASSKPIADIMRNFSSAAPKQEIVSAMIDKNTRAYDWVDREAEEIIAKAYSRHRYGKPYVLPVRDVSTEDLEKLGTTYHYPPQSVSDHLCLGFTRFGRWLTKVFFRERHAHHALVLETVAAVPGIVAAASRHLRSLRTIEVDNGWINPLEEEAENERMHLLIWMHYCKPSRLERFIVVALQAGYLGFYSLLYVLSPKSAHRMVGYLEEGAASSYTEFLEAVDNGTFPDGPVPDIAIKYYRLPEDAKLRDLVLHVRADECMHREFNHMLANKHLTGDLLAPPYFPAQTGEEFDLLDNGAIAAARQEETVKVNATKTK